MIYFVTGGIDSGKTSRMRAIFAESDPGTARGFLSVKEFCDGKFAGYKLEALPQGGSLELARLTSNYLGQYKESFIYDRFTFNCEAIREGNRLIADAAADIKCTRLFIDEIGPMELVGLAFHDALRNLFDTGIHQTIDVFIGIRSQAITAVSDYFQIQGRIWDEGLSSS